MYIKDTQQNQQQCHAIKNGRGRTKIKEKTPQGMGAGKFRKINKTTENWHQQRQQQQHEQNCGMTNMLRICNL